MSTQDNQQGNYQQGNYQQGNYQQPNDYQQNGYQQAPPTGQMPPYGQMPNYQQSIYIQNGQPIPKENVFLGIIGAVLGSLIGVACIVLLEKLGYVASLSGVVMGVCTIKGYRILGKGFSLKGLITCAVVMIAMVYVSNWISFAFVAAEVLGMDFGSAFASVPSFLSQGVIDNFIFYKELGMLYLFTALGAVPTLRDYFRK